MYLITWLILSFLVGKYAEKKGHGLWSFVILSLFISPIGGFIVVLIAGDKKNSDCSAKGQEYRKEAPSVRQSNQMSLKESASEDTSIQADKLLQLKDLLDKGVLTQEEFEKKKKEIIESPSNYSRPKLPGRYVFKAKQLSTAEKLLNLGANSTGLEYFEYNNGSLYVKMHDGKILKGNINQIAANFTSDEVDNVTCTLQLGTQMVSISSVWHLLDEEEWWNLFNILTHCGAVFNLDGYLKLYNTYHSKVEKTIRLTGVALNIITPFIS